MTVEVVTFGCRLNFYESEAIKKRAGEAQLRDAVVVNTCAVTAEAVRQSRQMIRRLKQQNPERRIIVTGCAAQIEPQTYAGMAEVQVLDDRYEEVTGKKLDPRQVHGAAYGIVAAARGYQHPAGEWNFQEVTVTGSKIKVELNGTVILDTDLSKATINDKVLKHPQTGKDRTNGFFGFAGHNDPVAFKEVAIKKL